MISEADYRKHRYLIWRLVWDLQSDGPGNPRFLSVRMSGNQNIYEFWSIVNWARAFSLAAALITWPGPWLWLAAGEKRYFVSDRRLRGSISSLTLGILLKYPFCFDLSFDWNCPEKIACDQNMPHQFLSNHWRYFDREDCFLTKPINLQTRKQQRRIIRRDKSSLDFSKS